MTEKKARLYTVLIKIAICIIASAFLILFICQYSKIIKLQSQNDALKSNLISSTEYNQSLEEQINQIKDENDEEKPSDEYVVDTAHGNGYVEDGEIIINGN